VNGAIQNLYHYPVKGLSAQPLTKVELSPGEGFPFDRVFGLARHDSGFDPSAPRPIPKDRFIVLVKEERLAGLQTSFDPVSRRLVIKVQDRLAFEDDLSSGPGIEAALSFFSTMFDLGREKRPLFAYAAPHRFTDVSVVSTEMMNAVSLINLDSVRDLENRIGRSVHPLRFRANIYFDGWPPFSELSLLDRVITIGDVRLKISMRTRRCAATEVNPLNAKRDIPVPRLIMQNYGHSDMGIYAEILDVGVIRPGDPIVF
jgi:hypothetical protein